jgi:hypothetical protein
MPLKTEVQRTGIRHRAHCDKPTLAAPNLKIKRPAPATGTRSVGATVSTNATADIDITDNGIYSTKAKSPAPQTPVRSRVIDQRLAKNINLLLNVLNLPLSHFSYIISRLYTEKLTTLSIVVFESFK